MKSSQADSPKTESIENESDEETWGDKLVIDLDSANMSNADNKTSSKSVSSPDSADGDNTSTKTKESSKSGRADSAPPVKTKSKRNGQKRGENNKSDTTYGKGAGRGARIDKDKPTGNKPGRKKKEKQSPVTVKTETTSEPSHEDPYKFDEGKIASTAIGKSDAKPKNIKACKDAQTEYEWRSVGVATEPENFGPCEPGTQVCLEGIVWQETCNGVLVVNVTWKGKTYMGTLLDATKHDWSPPSCDSPTGDFEGRTPKGRGKRSRVPLSDTFKDINERKLRKEMRKQSGQNQSRPKSPNSPKAEGGKRKGRSSEGDGSEPLTKRGRGQGQTYQAPSPPALIECPEPNCGKKYKQMNGLKYHQRNAHRDSSPHVSSDTTSETNEKAEPVSSPEEVSVKVKCENEAEEASVDTSSPVRNNTTSVITAISGTITSATTPPSANVPVATITPQVVKPVASESENNGSTSSNLQTAGNRAVSMSGPPQLASKPTLSNGSMAPISTLSSQGGYNPALKPIQPKPTILGEVTPHPGLHDLMDQKRMKRKRSVTKEDMATPPSYMDVQKPSSGMHKFEAEHRGLLSTGGLINASADAPSLLQSPAYSDISDEGELKNAARRDMVGGRSLTEGLAHSQNFYPIATVSPQKNVPSFDKDSKKQFNRQTPSHSPVPSRSVEEKQKQMQFLAGWSEYNNMIMQQSMAAAKEKLNRSISPKPNPSYKASAPVSGRDVDSKMNNDRLQLLRENMDMKSSTLLPRPEGPRDYSISPNTSSDYAAYHEHKHREALEQDHHKHELLKNLSPAAKLQQSTGKLPENKLDSKPSRSPPMPAPTGLVPSLISNSFLQHQIAAMQQHSMLAPGFPPGLSLPPGFPYRHLAGMSSDKDNRNSSSPSFGSKTNHKIHELEGRQSSKSPRPSSSDRQCPKTSPMPSQAGLHSAMLSSYSANLQSSIPGLFQPPK